MHQSEKVFDYFKEICAIPHGSGNMDGIAAYCMAFAHTHGLRAVRDTANNVIIYKEATKGYEKADTVILQGHLDMVCQKTADSAIDFEKDGLQVYIDGDYLRAKGTTLGADNGIAVAMILALLESDDVPHPAIEAVFTTDEEIGMVGAMQLDMTLLKGKKLINLDAEEDDTLTVSCAGGSECGIHMPVTRQHVEGTDFIITFTGLQGGHSGVEIHKGRTNAAILAGQFLTELEKQCHFTLIDVNSGDKDNAIPHTCTIHVCTTQPSELQKAANVIASTLKDEIKQTEPHCYFTIKENASGKFEGFTAKDQTRLLYALTHTPNGVLKMSEDIPNLVETSLNLGVLKTEKASVCMRYALRSNVESELTVLEQQMQCFADSVACEATVSGHYPPWEYAKQSPLREIFIQCYTAQRGEKPKIEAIHAGLECGVFASRIQGLDCIACGPALFDVHTVNEKLSISSTERTYQLLLKILENCK